MTTGIIGRNFEVTPDIKTLVAYTSGSICAGGVQMDASWWISKAPRQPDSKNALADFRPAPADLKELSPLRREK